MLSVAGLLTGCGGSRPGVTPQGSDLPQVVLHGYAFGASSNVVNHRFLSLTTTTPPGRQVGWGTEAGVSINTTWNSGGLVAGVKTVLALSVIRPAGLKQRKWFAQDTQGNVHNLKQQTFYPSVGHWFAAELLGVAAGPLPDLVLPKGSALTTGYVWYGYSDGTLVDEYTVLGTNATWRGRTGLLRVRWVGDANGDGIFNPSWSGPDDRGDDYWDPHGTGLGSQTAPTGGFIRK